MSRRWVVVACAVALVGVAPCAEAARDGTFTARGSVEQVAVTGAKPGATARLLDARGTEVAHGTIDRMGSLLFRHVAAGSDYTVTGGKTRTPPVSVMAPTDTPPESFYRSQSLGAGYSYLRTRDGTLLSVNVVLPGPADRGPYPTVVEYSGYDPSNPKAQQPASRIAQALGYATVGVNMRGTGCSGGAWDYFEPLQSLDGYDVIETVAAQPWVAGGKVGMVGISYPGVTQLFVAATRPPHLAAITPLSVIDDTYRGTLFPGGIFNNGFALDWAKDRQYDARPAGQPWAKTRIAAGDATCKANQALRLQAPNVLRTIDEHRYYEPGVSDSLAPATFVRDIQVPVFLAGAWQDEETGGHFADMLDRFDPATKVRFTLMNGVHADSLAPDVITRWAEFLDFYVARRVPRIPPALRLSAPVAYNRLYGVTGIELPPDRFSGYDSFAAALAAYEAEPPVRVLFDSGSGGPAGAPIPGFEVDFAAWPPPATEPVISYFADDGRLTPQAPTTTDAADRWTYDPGAFPRTSGPRGHDVVAAKPNYDWKPVPAGKAAAYVSEPLRSDTVMLGSGSVDLWLRSTAPDVDLEVTLTEVRPDGQETYVQSGWLRASHRKLDDAASSELRPVETHRKPDAAPLPRGEFSLVRVPLFPFGHVFRAGSRVRITVQPPGGNRPLWTFDTIRYRHRVTNEIGRSRANPSRVVLPVVPGIMVPTSLPRCGTLRGQPCRQYIAASGGS